MRGWILSCLVLVAGAVDYRKVHKVLRLFTENIGLGLGFDFVVHKKWAHFLMLVVFPSFWLDKLLELKKMESDCSG